jgi:tRNA (cytosine38-C5)-methyltransferase
MESIKISDNSIIDNQTNILVFEFFSGIGGMHEALREIKNIKIIKIYPFDINKNANEAYYHNFKIKPFSITIEGFSLEDYEKIIESNLKNSSDIKFSLVWTMSPPCQPFTRQGKVKGLSDNRTKAFVHLMDNIFMKTKYLPDYFFLENVKNFEISEANKMLTDILNKKNYSFLQFLLSPIQFNIPNKRLRFYLIASIIKKFNVKEYTNIPNKFIDDANILFKEKILPKKDIQTFLNFSNNANDDSIKNKNYYLTKETLEKKSCLSMDIALLGNTSTNCFTKGYTKLFKGAGSILLLNEQLYKKQLNPTTLFGFLRYFTPNEILKFLFFSDDFSFTENFTEKTKYKLLGNSINVKVVNILMDYLFNED